MHPLPASCPADLILDTTDIDAFNAAYRAAERQDAVFVAAERQGERWTVQADALTARGHAIDATSRRASGPPSTKTRSR